MSIGNILATAAPIAAGYFAPGAGAFLGSATANAVAAGALTGMGIAALSGGDVLSSGVMGGLGGYSGGELFTAFNPADAVKLSGAAGSTTAVANEAMLSPYTNLAPTVKAAGTGAGNIGMMANPAALSGSAAAIPSSGIMGSTGQFGPNMGQINTNTYAINPGVTGPKSIAPVGARIEQGALANTLPNADSYGTTGLNNKVEGIINDPSKAGGYAGNPAPPERGFSASIKRLGGGDSVMGYGKLGLAGLPVVASAFEPETFTYDQMKEDEAYDPNETLNLNDPALDSGIEDVINEDSGLRLYANQGGMVPTYAEGGTIKSRAEEGMAGALARNKGIAYAPSTSTTGMAGALARNEGTAYARPTTAPSTPTTAPSDIKIAGADNLATNLTGGLGALNVNSGTVGQSPDAKAAEDLRKTQVKMMNGYEVPIDFVPASPGSVVGGMSGSPQSHYYDNATSKWVKGQKPGTFRIGGSNGIGNQYGQFSGYGGPAAGVAKYAGGGMLEGPGDGMSDSLAAKIDESQPAALSQGEFVVPADVVSHLGNGSSNAGSKRLYAMMDKVRQARTGTEKQGKEINPERYMPA